MITTGVVFIEGFAYGYYVVRRTTSGYDRLDSYVKAQVSTMPRGGYSNPADESWFAPYWKEFNDSTFGAVDSTSYSNSRRRPFKGRYINVDQSGRRVTWKSESDSRGSIQIALFGGATVWGTGARDEFTIPSYVSKMVAERYPHQFEVVNYGQDGYVSTQEVIEFLREVQKGNIPQIVVFYDGFNDMLAAIQPAAAGFPLNEDERRREFNILHPSRAGDFWLEALNRTNTFQLIQGLRERFWPETLADSIKSDNEALAGDVVRTYFRNVDIVCAIAKRFGTVPFFFWQPSVFTKARPTAAEESMIQAARPAASFEKIVRARMREAQTAGSQRHFRDISGVLDSYAGTAFIGTSHTTELANEAIAREIVFDLDDTLEQELSLNSFKEIR